MVASISPNGRSVATNTIVRVVEPERRQIDQQVMPVGQRQRDRGDVGAGRQRRLAHRVERVLHRAAVVRGEGLDQRAADRAARAEVGRAGRVRPRRGDRRRHDAILGVGQRRELVARKAGERRVRRLQHDQVGKPGRRSRRRCASRVTTAVHCSPPGCTKACGCGWPPADSRPHGCSIALIRTRDTAGLARNARPAAARTTRRGRSDRAAPARRRCSSSCRWRDTDRLSPST